MAHKKTYPGGFRLTLATARKLAHREFGTAKGLEMDGDGHYRMDLGNLQVAICPDYSMSGRIRVSAWLSTGWSTCVGYYDRETLEPDDVLLDQYARCAKREALESWAYGIGAEACHKEIDRIWNREGEYAHG